MPAFLNMTNHILTILAGMLGACGVTAAAVAAHGGYGENLRTAAIFALIHAALVIALTRGTATRMGTLAAALTLTGALLFCGDITVRSFIQQSLFPMAAPAGGFLMIGGWLMASLDAALRLKPTQS